MQVHRWIARRRARPTATRSTNSCKAFLTDSIASPTRYIGEEREGAGAASTGSSETGAEGVLFCAPSFCDPALLDQPMTVAAVRGAGIPWTAFKYAENTGQFQVIREQAGTFADSIKLWSGADE